MNLRVEYKKLRARVDALEKEVAELKAAKSSLESRTIDPVAPSETRATTTRKKWSRKSNEDA